MRRLFLAAAVVAAVAGLPPPRAEAGFKVSLSQTGAGTTVYDLDNAATVAANFDVFTFANGDQEYTLKSSAMVGDYRVQGSFVISNHPGSQDGARLAIGNNTVTRMTALYGDPLAITVTQTGFTAPTGPGSYLGLTGAANFGAGSNPAATATLTASIDLGNNEFAQGGSDAGQVYTSSGILRPVGSGTLSEVVSGSFTLSGPYSLTTSMVVSGLSVGQRVSGLNAEAMVHAPAPAGLVLAASGVPFLGLVGWLRRRGTPVPSA